MTDQVTVYLSNDDVDRFEILLAEYPELSRGGIVRKLIQDKYTEITGIKVEKKQQRGFAPSDVTQQVRRLPVGLSTYIPKQQLPSGVYKLISDARRHGRKISFKKDDTGWKITRIL